MKIILLFLLMITLTSKSQVNDKQPDYISAGIGVGNVVYGNLSYTHHNTGLQLSGIFNQPFSSTEKPILWVAALGLQIPITNFDENNYHITPQIGYAKLRTKDDNSNLFKKDSWYYGLELCKYAEQGVLFLQANYTTQTYVTFGIRFNFDL